MSPTEGPSPQMRDIMLRAYIKSKYETLGKNPNDITDHVIEVASTQLAATEIVSRGMETLAVLPLMRGIHCIHRWIPHTKVQ